jgi:hypothetical protein
MMIGWQSQVGDGRRATSAGVAHDRGSFDHKCTGLATLPRPHPGAIHAPTHPLCPPVPCIIALPHSMAYRLTSWHLAIKHLACWQDGLAGGFHGPWSGVVTWWHGPVAVCATLESWRSSECGGVHTLRPAADANGRGMSVPCMLRPGALACVLVCCAPAMLIVARCAALDAMNLATTDADESCVHRQTASSVLCIHYFGHLRG